MGSLAVWGGIGGAGAGMEENSQAQRKVDLANMEADRQMALAKFSQDNENARQTKQLTSEEGRTHEEVAGRTANVATEQSGLNARTQAEIGERGTAAANRSEALIKIGAGHDAARKAALEAAKNAKSGWSQKVIKQSGFDPKSHLPTETDSVAVTHPAYGTFIQSGDKFVPQGTPPASLKRARTDAVTDLLTNPDRADSFVEAYGYLPTSYFKVLAGKGQLNMASNDPIDTSPSSDDPAEAGRTPAQIAQDNEPAE